MNQQSTDWVRVFSSEQEAMEKLSNKIPQLVIIGTRRICLVRFENRFYAVQDACTHNGESLSKGNVNFQGEIICPWHNYRFELNTGRACDSNCRDLITYPLKADSSGFFIGI